ncbi:hypothetical protein [Kitasatospora sp. NPDC005856]|uniref:hypothetical protein n=1 Tax=Kitasatospora sp. NPDC005856 TaxID=3154566 RepID=UPI0033E93113
MASPSAARPSPLWPTPSARPVFRVQATKPMPLARHHQGVSMTTTMLLIMVPAVIAAAALRPGHGGRGRGGRANKS